MPFSPTQEMGRAAKQLLRGADTWSPATKARLVSLSKAAPKSAASIALGAKVGAGIASGALAGATIAGATAIQVAKRKALSDIGSYGRETARRQDALTAAVKRQGRAKRIRNGE